MTNLTSNASNFSSYFSTGVDPRTGLYTFSVQIGDFFAHKLSGEHFPLMLQYSVSSASDMGFGRGWQIILSSFNRRSSTLSLSTGQSFALEWNSTTEEYDIPYRKLKDIRVFYLPTSKEIKVVYKDGRQDFIDYEDGYLKRIVFPLGRAIHFEYSEADFIDGMALSKIKDNDGREVLLDWWSDPAKAVVTHKFNNQPNQTFEFTKDSKRLTVIKLPGETYTLIQYDYVHNIDYDLITKVVHPTGMEEHITYLNEGHALPDGAGENNIPYVVKHILVAGAHQPDQVTCYEYSDKNYLGFDSEQRYQPGEDTLFKAHRDYVYSSTEIINEHHSVTRYYNKFHLQTRSEHHYQSTLFKQVENTYFADSDVGIEFQPATYSLLKSQTTTHYDGSQTKRYTQRYRYDDYANLLSVDGVDGSKIEYVYYPAAGESGACPAHPTGMVALLKTRTVIPPPDAVVSRKPRITTFTYKKVNSQSLDASTHRYFMVLATTQDDIQTQVITYYDDTNQSEIYGRVKTERQTFKGYTSLMEYFYQFEDDGLETQAQLTTHDNVVAFGAEKVDYVFGKVIEQTSIDGVVTQFVYDHLGRMTQEIVAAGSPYESTKTYRYTVGRDRNCTIVTDAKGNTIKTYLNNAGKVVLEKQTLAQDESGHGTPLLKEVKSYVYDSFGLMVSQTEMDWLNETMSISLTTQYQYDKEGHLASIIHPDGRKEIITSNLVTLQTEYCHQNREGQTLLVERTTFDMVGQVISKESRDTREQLLARTKYEYDGYGNLTTVADTEGRVTQHYYDELDRLIETRRMIDDTPVTEKWAYPEFTMAELPSQVLVNGFIQGERRFDSLLRLQSQAVPDLGETRYTYTGVSSTPDSVISPNNAQINITHSPYLPSPESITVTGDETLGALYTYDKQTMLMLSNQNQGGTCQLTRDSYGRVLSEMTNTNGEKRQATCRYSLLGKLLQKKDYFGHVTTYDYDSFGRLSVMTETEPSGTTTKTILVYDSFSRPVHYMAVRDKDTAEITLIFNAMGMETRREAIFNNEQVFIIEQEFNPRLLLESRVCTQGERSTRETFTYDELNRLSQYEVTGANAPTDEQGNTLRCQTFEHDVYGNIISVNSTFTDETANTATYTYSSANPQKLDSLSNTHKDYPALINFSYDTAGNLLNDEQGRTYAYNALNQMVSVSTIGGEVLSQYQYNAEGKVVSQSVAEGLIYMFYLNAELSNEAHGETHSSYSRFGPGFAERKVTSSQENAHQFMFGNSQNSVLETYTRKEGEGEPRVKTSRKYTPYGEESK
ncbi:RHS repeat protein [Photobacterium leiognathi subsp. mandapamensis]|uniref:RHS repeat protein n=1 Tax=Photobacterium leiognathi TaxID=553611 RepID=UPI003AF34428